MLVPTHHEPHDAAIGVIPTRAMRLVDDQTGNVPRVESSFRQIVLDRLRRAVDDALGRPRDCAKLRRRLAGELHAVGLRDSGDVVAGLDLLSDERTSWCEEDDLALRVPAVEVEPVRGRRSQKLRRKERWYAYMTQAAIKVFPSPVGKLTSVSAKRARWTMLY